MRPTLAPLALALTVLGLHACAAAPPSASRDVTTPDDAASTAGYDAALPDAATMSMDASPHDDGPPTFTMELIDTDVVVAPGGSAPLDVRIVRRGGFDGPVLVELAGLPDPLQCQAREARTGDERTRLTIRAPVDVEPLPRTPFVVQASSEMGLRQSAPAHVTLR